MIGKMRWAAAAALLLLTSQSMALGLGQIQVKSKRNQPLLAEIPIISTTPGELVSLQARLASPETFRRVGLEPPNGITHDLQFSLGSDAQGRPVIRVSTTVPVDQPALSFLIEVDWGKGRLVREYSALVDAPVAATSTMQLAMQAPQAAEEHLVQRPELPVTELMSKPEPAAELKPAVEVKPEAKPAPTKPAPSVPQIMASANAYGPVKVGESLSHVASRMALRQTFSLEQVMLALLQENPEAFIGGDINRLRKGAVLRIPEQDVVASTDATQARRAIYQQIRQLELTRQPVRQPSETASVKTTVGAEEKGSAPAIAATPADKTAEANAANNSAKRAPSTAARPAVAKAQDARLQIVAAVDASKATGAKTGTNVGGEGSMLQQELRQRDEDIAAKALEISELKERVAALEKLKSDQQQLIQLKDSELAAVQQRLAEANQAQATQQAAPAKTEAVPVAASEVAKTDSHMTPYIWGGAGVVVLALLAWLLAGRGRQQKKPVRRNVFEPQPTAVVAQEEVAQGDASPVSEETVSQIEDVEADQETPITPAVEALPVADEAASEAAPESASESSAKAEEHLIDLADVPQSITPTAMPEWYSGWVKTDVEPPAPTPAAVEAASVMDDVSDEELERKLEWMLETEPKAEAVELALTLEPKATGVTEPELELALEGMLATDELPQEQSTELSLEPPAQASSEQRFKMVHAFLEMGDEYSAQQMLLELLTDENPDISAEAERMLSKLAN